MNLLNHKRTKKREDGFTMIELVIVGFVIAIMATVSIPLINRNLQAYRAESSIGMIAMRMNEARLTSIKRNKPVWMEADPRDNSLKLRSRNENNQVITVGPTVYLPKEAVIEGGKSVQTTFNSLGRLNPGSTSGTSVSFPALRTCKRVKVLPNGKVKVKTCDDDDDDEDNENDTQV